MCLRNSLNAGFHWHHNGVYYHTGALGLWMIFWPLGSQNKPGLTALRPFAKMLFAKMSYIKTLTQKLRLFPADMGRWCSVANARGTSPNASTEDGRTFELRRQLEVLRPFGGRRSRPTAAMRACPVCRGGSGLRSMATVAPAAFCGAPAAVLPDMLDRREEESFMRALRTRRRSRSRAASRRSARARRGTAFADAWNLMRSRRLGPLAVPVGAAGLRRQRPPAGEVAPARVPVRRVIGLAG